MPAVGREGAVGVETLLFLEKRSSSPLQGMASNSTRKKLKTGPAGPAVPETRRVTRSTSAAPNQSTSAQSPLANSTSGTPLSTQESDKEQEEMDWESGDGFEYSGDEQDEQEEEDDDEDDEGQMHLGSDTPEALDAIVLSDDEEQDQAGKKQQQVIILSSDEDDEDDTPASPPARTNLVAKGKMTSRKQYSADVAELIAEYGSKDGKMIKEFKKQGDEAVQVRLDSFVRPLFQS